MHAPVSVETKESRVKRLREATHSAHERLDRRIMSAEPFASRERFGIFLKIQHGFHRDIDALYRHPVLDKLLPELESRRRLDQIEQDLKDIGVAVPGVTEAPAFDAGEVDVPTAFGWLYVAEGSNLGAAFLLKNAAVLGLNEEFGARHLAGHPDGRGLHWRTFTAALDALELTSEEELRASAGAVAAFRRVHRLVEEMFG